jgi:predicted transcriptional regulator
MEKLGPLCIFKPAVSRALVVTRAVEDFIANVLDNSVAPLFQHLANSDTINKKELAAIKELLRKAEERRK